MPTCFVIQPFDADKFDKRFEQVFKPAIIVAGLDPYRVDQDPHVDIPIDGIESGIRSASICLADITTDNPNVWYELGYAFCSRNAGGHGLFKRTREQEISLRYSTSLDHSLHG